jgi:2-haloacid dehalogenase
MQAVVFDIGGVLIDWDPRHLYRKLIPDAERREYFLAEVCTLRWHSQHDAGTPFTKTIPPLVAEHPEWEPQIRAWEERFDEMWGGLVPGTTEILSAIRLRGIPVFAATNWQADGWRRACRLFPCLNWFDGALVSGEEGIAKPDPRFFDVLVDRFGIDPRASLYIDDNEENVLAATNRGFSVHHFVTSAALAEDIRQRGLLGTIPGHSRR